MASHQRSSLLTWRDIAELIKKFDVDGNGLLELDEFANAWADLSGSASV